jgi:hypothetical protein
MWTSLIAVGIAASVSLSVVNLASQIDRVRDARHSPVVEFAVPHNVPDLDQFPSTSPVSTQKSQQSVHLEPGV